MWVCVRGQGQRSGVQIFNVVSLGLETRLLSPTAVGVAAEVLHSASKAKEESKFFL